MMRETLDHRNRTLILAGHGSLKDPYASESIMQHAISLKQEGIFQELRTTFWKEEPSFSEVLKSATGAEIYIVPIFMSAGYFTQTVLPREIKANAASILDRNQSVYITDPVGTHPDMSNLILQTVTGEDIGNNELNRTGLALVGHGTERNPNSSRMAKSNAEYIRENTDFAEIHHFFLDQSPHVSELTAHFSVAKIIVMPLFVSEGPHTRIDIPAALGFRDPEKVEYSKPTSLKDKQIIYQHPIGTHPEMKRIILDRVREVYPTQSLVQRPDTNQDINRPLRDAARDFIAWISNSGKTSQPISNNYGFPWGQLLITLHKDNYGDTRYGVKHIRNAKNSIETLETHSIPEDAHSIGKFSSSGEYRPLKSSPDLNTGWIFPRLTPEQFIQVVDYFYPASIDNWHLQRDGKFSVTHFQEMAERQTGIYEKAWAITADELRILVEQCCDNSKCLKQRLWQRNNRETINVQTQNGRIPCTEPCAIVLEEARQMISVKEKKTQ